MSILSLPSDEAVELVHQETQAGRCQITRTTVTWRHTLQPHFLSEVTVIYWGHLGSPSSIFSDRIIPKLADFWRGRNPELKNSELDASYTGLFLSCLFDVIPRNNSWLLKHGLEITEENCIKQLLASLAFCARSDAVLEISGNKDIGEQMNEHSRKLLRKCCLDFWFLAYIFTDVWITFSQLRLVN